MRYGRSNYPCKSVLLIYSKSFKRFSLNIKLTSREALCYFWKIRCWKTSVSAPFTILGNVYSACACVCVCMCVWPVYLCLGRCTHSSGPNNFQNWVDRNRIKGTIKRAELHKCDIFLVSRILWQKRIIP